MNKIDNSDLILELFNYKKELTLEQEEIGRQVSFHMALFNCDETGKQHSQKNIVRSLTEKLKTYTYDKGVKNILEQVNGILKNDELFYDLEDLYRTLENANQGMVYSHVIRTVLDIINESDARNQQIKILNELAIQDWIPAVKNFIFRYTTNPQDRQNISSKGGKADNVFSIVEEVSTEKETGFLTFIGEKWFFITEKNIEPRTPSDLITETEKLHSLNLLQKALTIGTIENEKIEFTIDEDLSISIDINNGEIFINNEKANSSASVESIFDSALIPYMRKDLYLVVSETVKNLGKFAELDIVKKVSNITNSCLECYAFNYKDKLFLYSKDSRYGNNFYEYESATSLCNEMNNQLGYDLSTFLKNKFSKEVNKKKDLENTEQFIADKLANISENITKLETCGLITISEEIKMAHEVLLSEKITLEKELFSIKGNLSNTNWK